MISKESKAVILENLSSSLTIEKNARKSSQKLFASPNCPLTRVS